jgi:hypothetical protein
MPQHLPSAICNLIFISFHLVSLHFIVCLVYQHKHTNTFLFLSLSLSLSLYTYVSLSDCCRWR